MVSTFGLVAEDFQKELGTVGDLLGRAGSTKVGEVIDLGVRIAASNASMLLIAATFEEFVRQMVKEAAAVIIDRAKDQSGVPQDLLTAVWDRSIYLLKGSKFGTRGFDISLVGNPISALTEFCLGQKLSSDVAELVAFNQNNMKVKELNDIFKRVGLTDICKTIGKKIVFIEFFGSPDEDHSHGEFVAYLDRFYAERNAVAHSIASRRVAGLSDLVRHLDFFRDTSSALVSHLEETFSPS